MHTNAKMSINACISCCTGQILVVFVLNMYMSLVISVFLCQTKINQVDMVTLLASSHEEVIRFYVSVYKIL
jgi:hypothetical protein